MLAIAVVAARRPVQADFAERLWSDLLDHMPAAGLERVKGMLATIAGTRAPRLMPMQDHIDGLFMPDLPSQPWPDIGPFGPIIRELESRFPELRREILAEVEAGTLRPYGLADDAAPIALDGLPPGWDELKLWDGMHPSANILRLPASAAAVNALLRRGEILNQFTFLTLKPKVRIPPHCDRANWFVSIHMGIVVPQPCGIRVGDETRTWDEGKCIALDNSYRHEAWNDSGTTRIILAVQVGHPSLTSAERSALWWLQKRTLNLQAAGPEALEAWARAPRPGSSLGAL